MKYKVLLFGLLLSFSVLIQAQKPTLVIPRGHALKVTQIEPNGDFSLVATIDDSRIIHIWDAKTHEEYYQFYDHPAGMVSVDFHPEKFEFLSSDEAGNVFIWDLTKTKIRNRIKENGRTFALFSNNGQKVITAGNGSLAFFNSANGRELSRKSFDGAAHTFLQTPSNELYIGTAEGKVLRFDSDGNLLGTADIDSTPIETIDLFPNTNKLAVGTSSGKVVLYDFDQSSVLTSSSVMSNGVYDLLVNLENETILVMGNNPDQYIKFLNPESLKDETPRKFKWAAVPKDDGGLRAMGWANDSHNLVYLADHDNVIQKWHVKQREFKDGIFKGTAIPVHCLDLDQTREHLIVGSLQKPIKIFDMTGADYPVLMEGHSRGTNSIDYHPVENVAVSIGNDRELKVWNTENQEIIYRIKDVDQPKSRVFFTSGHFFLYRKSVNEFELHNYKTKDTRSIRLDGVIDYRLSPSGSEIVFQLENGLKLFDVLEFNEMGAISIEGIRDFSVSDEFILALDAKRQVHVIEGTTIRSTFKLEHDANKLYAHPDGEFITYQDAALARYTNSAYHYSKEGKFLAELEGHQDFITDVLELNDRLLTSAMDGTIRFWKRGSKGYEPAGSWVLLRYEKFVINTPTELFDATPEAMKELHYVLNGEIVEVEQLKDTYYEPNLISKLSGYNDEPMRTPQKLSDLGIYPEFEIQHPNLNDGLLGINLTNKGGGIGKVVLVINGKEVSSDVRDVSNGDVPKMGINYDINGHPYLKNGLNTIQIKAYNEDGTLGSEPKTINVFYEEPEDEAAKVYAIVAGVSDYAGDELDLKYAAKDAADFAAALRISATNMIGGKNLIMEVLTTDQGPEKQPTKANIVQAFQKFSKAAKARDYLLIYVAGHGVNSGGIDGDFYYLTADAKDGKLDTEEKKKSSAISSMEFTELIKKVPALKQVMIVDACHSGTLMSTFGGKQNKTMSSEEVRAFERIKDRTGLFLLAGSAADAVSYETTLYGQGLLTYALLFGMKGAALRDGEYIDVLNLFQYAAKKVPELAADIGGIQRPEIRVPTGVSSFDIGKLEDADKEKITLVSPKPLFVHTRFQEESDFIDVLEIGNLLDRKLQDASNLPEAPIVYVDDKKFSGALMVRGRYKNSEKLIIGDVKVYDNSGVVLNFKVEAANAKGLVDKIYKRLMKLAQEGGV